MGLGIERCPPWMQHLSSKNKSSESIRKAYLLFKRRSNREFVPTTPNGHCGIYALQQFQHFFDGIPIYSRSNDVFSGRTQMVQALRRYRADLCTLLGAYPDMTTDQSIALLGGMVDERAAVHDCVKNDVEYCDSFAHVEGPLDFVAWSMEVKRNICVLKYGEMDVVIYSGISLPRSISLDAFNPDCEDIVLLYNAGHFDSLIPSTSHHDQEKAKDFVTEFVKNNKSTIK